MKYSLYEVKVSIPKMKAKRDALWVKLWPRPLSYYLTVIALNIGLTPNTISVLSIVDALIASVLISINNPHSIIIGLILLNFFIEFDCIDGMMARTLKKNSYMGEFYDALGGYTMCAFPLLAVGICALNTKRIKINLASTYILIIIAALGCICDILSRLIYQKYTSNEIMSNLKIGNEIKRENDSFYKKQKKISITYLRLFIDREFGIGGFFPPLVVLAYIVKCLDIIVILYSLYHILAYVAVMYIYCRKATLFEINNK